MAGTEKQVVQGGFVMGRTDESNQPNKVKNMVEVKTFLVLYTDKEGKDQVQLAFHAPGSNSVSLLKAQIQGQKVAAPATEWFTEQFLKLLQKGVSANGEQPKQV
jgi:hypothetical protein